MFIEGLVAAGVTIPTNFVTTRKPTRPLAMCKLKFNLQYIWLYLQCVSYTYSVWATLTVCELYLHCVSYVQSYCV